MKNTRTLSFFFIIATLLLSSCQKEYVRDDLVIGTTGNPIGQLAKLAITGTDVNVTYTYEYDNNNQLIDVVSTSIVGTQNITYKWHFIRDNAGKMLQYVMKANIPGYPESVTYTAHYPTGSVYFDYLTGKYDFAGLPVKDSSAFVLVNGKITKYATYGDYANSGYMLTYSTSYTYDNSGNNITGVSNYEATSTGTPVLAETLAYEFDSKPNALQLGQEAFVIGAERYFSKNNISKSVTTSYASLPAGEKSTAVYSFQYNAAGKPASAVVSDPSGIYSPLQFTYTYQ
jgi:uncharacterized lipoprotein YehR (DUF1307 family)